MNKDLARRKRGFSAVPFLGDILAMSRLMRDGGAGWGPKLVTLLALVYVISPFDAFPEALAPAIGWLDDVGLILAFRLLLSRKLEPYRYPLFESPTPPPAIPPAAAASPAAVSPGADGVAERVVFPDVRPAP